MSDNLPTAVNGAGDLVLARGDAGTVLQSLAASLSARSSDFDDINLVVHIDEAAGRSCFTYRAVKHFKRNGAG
jgi:hypothetical protein